jgi:hypothetical protein
MSHRRTGRGSPRLVLGAAGWVLIALSACAAGAGAQRSGAAPPPEPAPPAEASAPSATAAATAAAPDSPAPAPAAAAATDAAPTVPAAPSAASAGADKMLPPCIPVRRARSKHRKRKQVPVLEASAPTGPPAPAPADAVVDAQVGEVSTSLGSILGRDVESPKGEDLGRVVDVLADAHGRVRVAIIDFGGFLGVGTRRIAVDWPLLRFELNARDKPLILSVDRQKLQSAPEYNPNKPRVLMPPAAPDAPDAGQAKK